MGETKRVVSSAHESMKSLMNSMGEIVKAGRETSKSVKTIDEIAFQITLFFLNAAVEAARAEEAGAGFAVVADELRNLAMRAAGAAKKTAPLIEDTIIKVKAGSGLVRTANEAFQEVAASSTKVGELVGEIAAASGEQVRGIEEVDTRMDKVTQRTAANAEESASEELKSQSEYLQARVNELGSLVGGGIVKAQAKNPVPEKTGLLLLQKTGIRSTGLPSTQASIKEEAFHRY